MGAEIIKVEIAPHGDQGRLIAFIRDKRSGYFVQQNRGKQSLCMDLKNPRALAILKELIPKVDVMVENFAPGVIGGIGLDYETVRALNPKIVMCSISTLGQTGPLSKDPGFDFIGQAYAGITSLIGEKDGPPYVPMVAIGDVSTGVHATCAIACALLFRERTGRGQHLDISLLDSYFGYHDLGVELHSASGGAQELVRNGLHHPTLRPTGTFKGKDKYIIIIAWLDEHWARLCAAMGKPEMARDPRYIDIPARFEHRDEIDAIITQWLHSMPSDEAAVEAMRAKRVPVAPILSVREAMNHPHLRERGTVRTINDRILGKFDVPGFPLRFSEFPQRLELEAPLLGEHNEKILTGYLGYTPERVRKLADEKVLFSAPH
jgi:crotonobetainyl-CoA:carnitine CoA-transferase CaiB-like acyl-CoA transferase